MTNNIIPSKPFKNYADIEALAAKAKGKVDRIQVDICDGEYVKNNSWPFTETAKNLFSDLYKKDELDIFMPEMYDISYTADLMCANPENYIETLVQYGFDQIIIHWRSIEGDSLKVNKILEYAVNYSLDLYIAIDVKTDIEKVKSFFIEKSEFFPCLCGVQVMGIENIGLQGQEFDERSLDIVKHFREFFDTKMQNIVKDDFYILFDGGINEDNIDTIKDSGVNVFCVGHLLTEGDFVENLKYLKKVLE